jgi:hypothetical protein
MWTNHRLQQIMGQRALGRHFLKLNCDGIGFTGTDPDWQVTVAGGVLQNDNTILRHQAHANAVDNDFNHSCCLGSSSVHHPAIQDYTQKRTDSNR